MAISKKNNLPALLIVGIFSLFSFFTYSGCLFQNQDEDIQISDLPMERRIGVIRSLGGAKTSNNGTHILQMDDGSTILLKSTAIDLDSEKYKSVTVEVRGFLDNNKDTKPLMDVMNIDIFEKLDEPEVETEEIPVWEDFSNAAMGFSVRYRDDFSIEETSSGVAFSRPVKDEETDDAMNSPEDGEVSMDDTNDVTEINTDEEMDYPEAHIVSILAEPKGNNESLTDYLGLASDETTDLIKAGISKSKVGADGLTAYKSTNVDSTEITYFLAGLDDFYTISFVGSLSPQSLEDRNLFYEMLSSFRLFAISDMDSDSFNNEIASDDENNMKNDDTEPDDTNVDEETENTDSVVSPDSTEEVKNSEVSVKLDDYNTFENDAFEFSIQYPKNWYFSGDSSSESGVIRSYVFADGPLEDNIEPLVVLNLLSGSAPSGTMVNVNNTSVTKVSKGGSIEVYVEKENRVYRLTGSPVFEDVLLNMASTIK